MWHNIATFIVLSIIILAKAILFVTQYLVFSICKTYAIYLEAILLLNDIEIIISMSQSNKNLYYHSYMEGDEEK